MISPVTGSIITSLNIPVVSATAPSFRIRPDPTHRYSDSPDEGALVCVGDVGGGILAEVLDDTQVCVAAHE
jgi:hypothetical protein